MCDGEKICKIDKKVLKIFKFIQTAIAERLKRPKGTKKLHWLDYAEEKHGATLTADTKLVLNCFKIFLAFPIFNAMYAQHSSRFVFQAARMDGDVGFYTIKPDQIMTPMSILTIVIVPATNYVFYPVLSKIGIRTMPQKMICGFFCCVLAFIAAAVVEYKIVEGEEKSVHILWLLPQLSLIAIADVFVWIPLVNLAYTQAPARMKSIMSSVSYLMGGVGSLLITFVSAANLIEYQTNEFLMYSGLMVVNIFYFHFVTKDLKLNE